MKYCIPLETERLCIEPFTEKYLTPKYISWLNDPEVVRYSRQRQEFHTSESCTSYMQTFNNTPNCFWAIVVKDKNIGHIGNMTAYVDQRNKVTDLGILIGEKKAQGQGYATDAWLSVCRYLFEQAGIRKITAGCLATNTPMLALMKRSGMVEDGRRLRHFLWEGNEVDIVHAALFAYPI